MDRHGMVAVVTGAGAGIGQAVARDLASRGVRVVVADLDPDSAATTAAAIRSDGGEATPSAGDVTSRDAIASMIGSAERSFGGLDILINNAGGSTAPFFPDAPIERWQRVIDVNLRGTMLAIQAAVPAMRRRGGGAIVNVASSGGIGFASYERPEYGAAKAGVVRLTASLGSLAQTDGIRVNCICPGLVDTPASRQERAKLVPDEQARLAALALRPEQIAGAIWSLIGDETMAGRVMIWYEGQRLTLVPTDSPW